MWETALLIAAIITLTSVLPFPPRSHPEPWASAESPSDPARELEVLGAAYPGIGMECSFDSVMHDWRIRISAGEVITELYWAEGRYLSADLLAKKDRYRRLFFHIPEKVTDPASFTQQQIERIRNFGSSENRKSAPVLPTSFFEAIYDTSSRESTERHIVKTNFLGRRVNVHERIVVPLRRVDERIRAIAKADRSAKDFMESIGSMGGYSWRPIRDTAGFSFHSMGLALDILPQGWENRIIYWNWEKNKGNKDWMLISLAERWMPPEHVIDIFESEGFVWGGKWAVWDNMHFEYRPELILGRGITMP